MRKVSMPSGAELVVNVAPFKDSKALFQAIIKEWKDLGPDSFLNMGKMFSSAFSSPDVEAALWPCAIRSLYNGEKITPDSFEAEEMRQDFIPVCLEVVRENIGPFTKSLFSGSETPNQPATEDPKSTPSMTL